MEGFRRGDHDQILACLTDDVEWVLPGVFRKVGKEEFDGEIENDAFVGRPDITVTRTVEDGDVVVSEGFVRTQKRTGEVVNLAFCDVFEMRSGRIRRLTSYLMEVRA